MKKLHQALLVLLPLIAHYTRAEAPVPNYSANYYDRVKPSASASYSSHHHGIHSPHSHSSHSPHSSLPTNAEEPIRVLIKHHHHVQVEGDDDELPRSQTLIRSSDRSRDDRNNDASSPSRKPDAPAEDYETIYRQVLRDYYAKGYTRSPADYSKYDSDSETKYPKYSSPSSSSPPTSPRRERVPVPSRHAEAPSEAPSRYNYRPASYEPPSTYTVNYGSPPRIPEVEPEREPERERTRVSPSSSPSSAMAYGYSTITQGYGYGLKENEISHSPPPKSSEYRREGNRIRFIAQSQNHDREAVREADREPVRERKREKPRDEDIYDARPYGIQYSNSYNDDAKPSTSYSAGGGAGYYPSSDDYGYTDLSPKKPYKPAHKPAVSYGYSSPNSGDYGYEAGEGYSKSPSSSRPSSSSSTKTSDSKLPPAGTRVTYHKPKYTYSTYSSSEKPGKVYKYQIPSTPKPYTNYGHSENNYGYSYGENYKGKTKTQANVPNYGAMSWSKGPLEPAQTSTAPYSYGGPISSKSKSSSSPSYTRYVKGNTSKGNKSWFQWPFSLLGDKKIKRAGSKNRRRSKGARKGHKGRQEDYSSHDDVHEIEPEQIDGPLYGSVSSSKGAYSRSPATSYTHQHSGPYRGGYDNWDSPLYYR